MDNDARKAWEEAVARRDFIFEKMDEGPAPPGFKRCMTCYDVMPYDEYCECFKEIGRDIRSKARDRCAGQEKEAKLPKPARKKVSNQGGLF